MWRRWQHSGTQRCTSRGTPRVAQRAQAALVTVVAVVAVVALVALVAVSPPPRSLTYAAAPGLADAAFPTALRSHGDMATRASLTDT